MSAEPGIAGEGGRGGGQRWNCREWRRPFGGPLAVPAGPGEALGEEAMLDLWASRASNGIGGEGRAEGCFVVNV